MTRLGFYIVHNNRYKLVKTVNVPWDFTIGGPDSDNPVVETPIIGEWQPQKLTYVVPINDIVFKDDYQFVIKRFKMVLTENEEEGIEKETLYRVTYGDRNIGVYEALRLTISKEDWDSFLENDKVSWLLIPPFEYKKGYRSFFTAEGYDKFKAETLPLISEYLDESAIKVETIEIIEQEPQEIKTDSSVLSKNGIESLLTALAEAGDEEDYEEAIPKPVFEDWVTEYFNDILFNEEGFFDTFNTDRTYIVIAEEDPSVMGFIVVRKGRSYINFKEHDYRNIINALYPAIRHDMAQIPDDSFGGYDDGDELFSQDKNKYDHSFGGYDDDKNFLVDSENKGIDTYPNLF